MSCNGTRDAVEEGRPTASGLEFVRGFVEGCIAGDAVVRSACGSVLVVLTCERGFGSLLSDYAELFCGWLSVHNASDLEVFSQR